jgi:hypothetical protein
VVTTELLGNLDVPFSDLCMLLRGAPDRCADHLAERLRREPSDFFAMWPWRRLGARPRWMPLLATREKRDRRASTSFAGCIPSRGPAQYRFSPERRVIIRRPFTGEPAALGEVRHPIGLPVEQVADGPVHTPITWHYLSPYLADIPGLPSWPADRLHLVSPRHHWS